YQDIIPFDNNRVKLESSTNNYINASHIQLGETNYIATQGPLEATAADFWQMCYQLNQPIIVIIMLTPLQEKSTERCFKYWPDETNLNSEMYISKNNSGSINDRINLISFYHDESEIDELNCLDYSKNFREKFVYQLWYDSWPDFSKPSNIDSILKISEKAKNILNCDSNDQNTLIVHCSAGVGRTGTFIALDYLINHYRDFDLNPDSSCKPMTKINTFDHYDPIFEIVMKLKEQRMSMVESQSQFAFIYDAARKIYQERFGGRKASK
ncbi:protein-tyrosine phosphatase, partial [Ascoidea rubescens DSM 1968]